MEDVSRSDLERRKRFGNEGDEWYTKRRRGVPERTEFIEQMESFISRINENTSSSIESILESLAQSLEADLILDMDRIISFIMQCVQQLPGEITVYSTLVGLLNAKKAKFGSELLLKMVKNLRRTLECGEFSFALNIVTFLADLVNCSVVSSGSLIEFYESFIEAAYEENSPQVRNDWLIYAVLHSLPWSGCELNDKEKEPLDNLLEGVAKYMLERSTSHAKLLQVWSKTVHEQEEYLNCLWSQISKLRDDGWVERHISRYYIAFDGSLTGAVQHNLSPFMPPPYCSNIVYPLPVVVFRFFDYADCPDTGPLLPGAHSIERFLIEEELGRIIESNHYSRKECASRLVGYRKKSVIPINYMILEVVFSQLLRLPHPPVRPLFYGSLMIELCRTRNMPQVIAQAAELFYQRIDTMQLECIDRLIDWFSYHMSNFDYRWSWADWNDCLDLTDYAPKRYFVKEVIEKCMRFSYHERICDCLPSSFEEITPEVPAISYREEERDEEMVIKIEDALRKKMQSQEMTEMLREFCQKEGSDQVVLSTFFAVVLNLARKSLSHNFAALTRYHETLKELCDYTAESSAIFLQTLYSVWKHNRQMMVVLITKMLRMSLLNANTVASWLLSHHINHEIDRFWLWEVLFVTLEYACKHLNRCKERLQRMQDKLSKMKRNNPILERDIGMEENDLKEMQEMLRNLFLDVLHKLVLYISEHIINSETNGIDHDTLWYRYMMGRFKQILLKYNDELWTMKQNLDDELFLTAEIDTKIMEVYRQFAALRA